jgi:SAM-dependent methyltransferase
MQCGLGSFSPQIVGGANLYETLAKQKFYYPATRWDHQTALLFLQRRCVGSILEFGCGNGRFLSYASRSANKACGFDFNGTAFEEARQLGLDAYERWEDVPELLFEAVVTFQTLEHVPDPGAIVRQLVDRVATGGYLIIAVPNEDGPLGEVTVNPLNAPPHHASLWPRSALEYIGKAYDLDLEVYVKEPINRALYFTVIEESLRDTFTSSGFFVRILQKVLRWKAFAEAAVEFAEKHVALDGHNHLAIYRKLRPKGGTP